MDENTNKINISHTKNLNKLNFNVTLNIPIDTNSNIKTILNISSYMFDSKVECGNGKAIITGKIGVKVLYIDTDNIPSTITDSTNFSETIVDPTLSINSNLNISNYNILNDILSTDGTLKINCEATILPISYLNLGISNNLNNTEMLITKKDSFNTCTISNFVNTQFSYSSNLETKDEITKILYTDSVFTAEKVIANNNYFVVEGKICNSIIYETQKDGDTVLKELKDISNVKSDIEANGLSLEDCLDLTFVLDKSLNNANLEKEDSSNVISLEHTIKVCGAILSRVTIDFVDDAFSTLHEIETTHTKRDCIKNVENLTLSEVVSNEIILQKEDTAIDETIANTYNNAEITNYYLKDNNIFFEGVITSTLSYIDENKEFKSKTLQAPFVVKTKIEATKIDCINANINIIDNKVKVKRGTIIEIEYSIYLSITLYEKETYEMIDNYTLGKQLSYKDYDYQIFIAKPNETIWQLCKRIKISPDNLTKCNKDLPLICVGGEKVIIKR